MRVVLKRCHLRASYQFMQNSLQRVHTSPRIIIYKTDTDSEANFTIREATSAKELGFVTKMACAENWGMASGDIECYFAADPNGHFIGELNGKQICSTSIVRYPRNRICHLGLGLTDPNYRGRGYMYKLLCTVLKQLPRDYCLQIDTTFQLMKQVNRFVHIKHIQFVSYCTIAKVEQVLESLALKSSFDTFDGTLIPVQDIDCGALCDYEHKTLNLYRKEFLRMWTSLSGRYGCTAVDHSRKVRGFAVCRKINKPSDVYKVAPLYADNPAIAKSLLKRITEHVSEQNRDGKLYLDIPSTNSHAMNMMNTFGGRVLWKLPRLQSRLHNFTANVSNVYGLTSQSVG